MRFHLDFEYANPKFPGRPSFGSQVVVTDTLEQAARWIASERGLSAITVKRRHHLGRPASESEIINREFIFGGSDGKKA